MATTQHKKQFGERLATPVGRLTGIWITPEKIKMSKYTDEENGKGSYRCGLVIPKGASLKMIFDDMEKVGKKAWGDDFQLSDLDVFPIQTGEEKDPDNEDFKNHIYLLASTYAFDQDKSWKEVMVVDKEMKPIDATTLKPGYQAQLLITAGTYVKPDTKDKGMKLWLNGVRMIKEDAVFHETTKSNSPQALQGIPGVEFIDYEKLVDAEDSGVNDILSKKEEVKAEKKTKKKAAAQSMIDNFS